MPDRIIRDELLESKRWVRLKDNADRLAYIALLLKADAHGNFTADPWRLLRLWLDFGITTEQAVAKTMSELVEHDLIRLYEHAGERYLHIPRYRQRLRYTARSLPRSPWCDTKEDQQDTEHSPGESQATDGSAPGAHRRRKEVKRSEVKEEKEVRAREPEPVDNSEASNTGGINPPEKLNGKTAAPDKWWTSNEGIDAKARELGIKPAPHDTYEDLKKRLFVALNSQTIRNLTGAAR